MVRLPLLINKQRIKTLEELRENFNLTELIERYKGGQLRAWLNCWDFSSELEQLEAISPDLLELELAEALCRLFSVEGNSKEQALTALREILISREQERQREEQRKAELERAKRWKQIQEIIHEILAVFIAFEKAFDIKIPADDVQRLKTVGEAFEYIEQKLLAKDNKKNVSE